MINIKDIPDGEYVGLLTDWGIAVNPYLNSPEVSLKFEFNVGEETAEMTFKSLWFTKAGALNKKTQDTLRCVGFPENADPRTLGDANLNNTKEYALTIETDKGYKQITWVNDPNGAGKPTLQASKSLDDFFSPKTVTSPPTAPVGPKPTTSTASPQVRANLQARKAARLSPPNDAPDAKFLEDDISF